MFSIYDISTHLVLGTTVRLVLLYYGDWQDQHMQVKYTDVDYHVFTDAARYAYQGKSPYLRHTYRYTPFLAWMLTPNIFLDPLFGKYLFIIFDVLIGYLLYKILCRMGSTKDIAVLAAAQWLYNPFTISISTRGNAESVVCSMVLFVIYFFCERRAFLTGLFCGLAIHFKIYAVIYCMAIYFSYGEKMHRSFLSYYFWPNRERFLFVLGVVLALVGLTAVAYCMYKNEFLEEAYFYHLRRKDHRHNFSLYHYLTYITYDEQTAFVKLLGFVPQALLLTFFSFRFHKHSLVPFGMFCNTFVFVTFNKVLTSQYYIWYLSLLPLVTAKVKIGMRKTSSLIFIWFSPQVLWLTHAYTIEFLGISAFFELWIDSIILFVFHIALLCMLIRLKFDIPK